MTNYNVAQLPAIAENNRLVVVIGANPYKVNVHFNNAATENMGDKIMRLIRNEVETTVCGASGGDSFC